jgi:triacylglycerol esterase/lipase EstA (alpha/beta hydrolase family)
MVDLSRPFHLFGHSAGGLIAKGLVKESLRPLSIVTMGTPHRSGYVADLALQAPDRAKILYQLFKSCGYDLKERAEIFASLKSDAESLIHHQWPSEVKRACVIGAPKPHQKNFIYQVFLRFPQLKQWKEPNDGLVEVTHQLDGEVLGLYELDHLQQLGFLGRRKEFERMCDQLAQFWTEPAKAEN